MTSSYIYIIGSENPPYKIGISKNPTRRLKNLQTGHPVALKILEIRSLDPNQTKLLETVIHRNLQHYKTHGEWFDLSLKEAVAEIDYVIMKYHDKANLRSLVQIRQTN